MSVQLDRIAITFQLLLTLLSDFILACLSEANVISVLLIYFVLEQFCLTQVHAIHVFRKMNSYVQNTFNRMVYLSGAGLPRLSWKKAVKRVCVLTFDLH